MYFPARVTIHRHTLPFIRHSSRLPISCRWNGQFLNWFVFVSLRFFDFMNFYINSYPSYTNPIINLFKTSKQYVRWITEQKAMFKKTKMYVIKKTHTQRHRHMHIRKHIQTSSGLYRPCDLVYLAKQTRWKHFHYTFIWSVSYKQNKTTIKSPILSKYTISWGGMHRKLEIRPQI